MNRTQRIIVGTLLAISLLVPGVAFGAKSEAQRLQEQLAALKDESRRAGEAYSKAYWKLDATKAKLASTDRAIKETRDQLAQANGTLSMRAAEMYRAGGADYLTLLLTADTFDDMLVRLEYVQRIGNADASVVEEVKGLMVKLSEQRAELEGIQLVEADEAADLKGRASKLESQLKSKQAEYDKLRAKLDAAVAAEKRTTGTTTVRVGSNGMIFPVRGSHYYSDTWGAARSGGRTHKGTDIMSPRGTPTVAVLSGTVRARANSLGGKTIWLTADNGWEFYYAHLDTYVRSSGRVKAGEVIGTVGSTGNASASAPHLHFEIHPNGGAAVNPYPYLRAMQQ